MAPPVTPTPTLTHAASYNRRQLWNPPTQTADSSTTTCAPFSLPSGGVLVINGSNITISSAVIYQPICTSFPLLLAQIENSTSQQQTQLHFYATGTPLIYVIAATTIIAWTLLIIVTIAPASSSNPVRTVRSAWLPRAIADPLAIVNAGSRPWLQKIAALMVTVAMTTVSADAFNVAEAQYRAGYADPAALDQVTDALEVKIIRVISDLILFLAQVQTLIRLFPRHKEKLVIKWFGYLLIILDTVFSCLNAFYDISSTYNRRPRSYQDAIPALSYLFQLSLNLLYAAWVFYFVFTKYRYAFYHPTMPTISIIAIISIVAILIPAVFFIADITVPTISVWGDFFRWVGAAASSIVVWEWVERIDKIEHEQKKDGILGREIFDGDEMLDLTPSDHTYKPRKPDQSDSDVSASQLKLAPRSLHAVGRRLRDLKSSRAIVSSESRIKRIRVFGSFKSAANKATPDTLGESTAVDSSLDPPRRISSVVDRTESHSADSTVYAVHYHPVTNTPPLPTATAAPPTLATSPFTPDILPRHAPSTPDILPRPIPLPLSILQTPHLHHLAIHPQTPLPEQHPAPPSRRHFTRRLPSLPFRRSRASPPLEIKNAIASSSTKTSTSTTPPAALGRQSLAVRMPWSGPGPSASASAKDKKRLKASEPQIPTIIPAPPRGHTWSPDLLRHSPIDPRQPQHAAAEQHTEIVSNQPADLAAAPLDVGSTTRDFATQPMPLSSGSAHPLHSHPAPPVPAPGTEAEAEAKPEAEREVETSGAWLSEGDSIAPSQPPPRHGQDPP